MHVVPVIVDVYNLCMLVIEEDINVSLVIFTAVPVFTRGQRLKPFQS